MSRTVFSFAVPPRLPDALRRLEELAGNLAHAWEPELRELFARIDRPLWQASAGDPLRFLRRVPQAALDRAAGDADLVTHYRRALQRFDALRQAPPHPLIAQQLPEGNRVAYFCAEFGVHESLPIYSGGLGVLAGDHCKAASELGLPLVAVGLLYRQGYFTQTIDGHGRQHAHAHASAFEELPVQLCCDEAGRDVRVSIESAGRAVALRLWRANIGRVPLILLDSDLPDNEPTARGITHQLYGGDTDMRVRQELVLGVGGLRALRALGHAPTVFHLNEGHAAFLVLERLREETAGGLDFDSALERVAGQVVFTTHTPVAAGHDAFAADHLRGLLHGLLSRLGAPEERVLALGGADAPAARFNMTTLALRGSRFHNGVSRIHGRVARRMERGLWPQARTADVPIRHITNGVHLRSFLAEPWQALFDQHLPGWHDRLLDAAWWQNLDRVPDAAFVATRRGLKRALLDDIAQRLRHQFERGGVPASIVSRALRGLTASATDPLVVGFARRFATYKRATLVLTDEARLSRLLGDPHRPALLIFAGKAHPRDQPAQALIQDLFNASLKPELIGRLLVVEGYDLALARRLVQGCDVWLNNPEYPLEACGTSGQKAGINGGVNVSVLDGWWDEGYVANGADGGPNGFAVQPADLKFWSGLHSDEAARRERDLEECRQLLDLLEHEVVPRYYDEAHRPYGAPWLRIARNAMQTLIPRYNSARMVLDYTRECYGPAARLGQRLAADRGAPARALAQWKQRVLAAWPGVGLRVAPGAAPPDGSRLTLNVLARLNGLASDDVAVECEWGHRDAAGHFIRNEVLALVPGERAGDEVAFTLSLDPPAGPHHYRLRVRPQHPALAHPFELGCVVLA